MTIRIMTPADIPLGMRLKAQNGWNQLEADWRRQLELEPTGCFVAEHDGQGVGTACACVFGPVAWIAMVLVDASRRGRGIGTQLMRRVLDYLNQRKVPSIRLDATPLGRPVYEKLGFVAEFTLHRHEGILHSEALPPRGGGFGWGGEGSGSSCPPTPTLPRKGGGKGDSKAVGVGEQDLPAIVALDRHITGTDRSALLGRLFRERPEEMRQVIGPGGIEGFVAARPGARAWQIGPCLGNATACRALLLDVWRRHAGEPVFLDIPESQSEARALASDMGLTVQRPLLRMGRGPRISERLEDFWSGFGPEKG